MAGGQERILRRRIKTRPVDEEDHARRWSSSRRRRIVKAQQRVHAAQPYSEQITEVVARPAAAGGGVQSARCSCRAPRSRNVALRRASPPTAGCAAATTPTCIRAAEGDDQPTSWRRARLRARHRRPQGRGLLPLPRLPDRRRVHRLQRQPDLRGRPRGRAGRRRAVRGRRGRPGRSSSTPASSRPVARRSCVEPLLPLEREPRSPTAGRRRRASRAPTTSSSRTPTRSSTRCCRATSRPASTPRCSNAAASRARRPPAGDEGRHRQRRRADHHASAGS